MSAAYQQAIDLLTRERDRLNAAIASLLPLVEHRDQQAPPLPRSAKQTNKQTNKQGPASAISERRAHAGQERGP